MAKAMKWIFLAMIVLLFSACSSYEVSTKFNSQELASCGKSKPVAHIWVKNYGYYLFNTIPLISGNAEKMNSMSWFTNNVEPKDSVSMLTQKAKELGATKVLNINTAQSESGAATMFIFWYRSSQSSGTAVQ